MNWIENRIEEALRGATELDLGLQGSVPSGAKDRLAELPPSILGLAHLRKLDLHGHDIRELPRGFEKLDNLTDLDLNSNGRLALGTGSRLPPRLTRLALSGVPSASGVAFGRLPRLERLELSAHDMTTVPESVFSLAELQHLGLGACPLESIPEGLRRLHKLQTLILTCSALALSDFSVLAAMGGIEHLHLSNLEQDWAGDALAVIGNLTRLRRLSLLNCHLKEVPRSWRQLDLEALWIFHASVRDRLTGIGGAERLLSFRRLRELQLFDSRLEELEIVLEGLTDLTHFAYAIAPLKRFPDQILRFPRLESLHLQSCGLTAIPPEIGGLGTLRYINLSFNQLLHKPSGISRLSGLEHLWLQGVPIQAIAGDFPLPGNLKTLWLGGNPLERWPDQVLELRSLETLSLPRCGITEISTDVVRLSNLTTLDLSYNRIASIPSDITKLPRLKTLAVEGNPITTPPPEVVEGGTLAIQEYFSALQESSPGRLFEAKLIIVGEGDVGKTCLARKLRDPEFDIVGHKEEVASTRGIDILEWHVATQVTEDFKINVWDFGGQEVYHATHQFFLTKRSLYIFVWDARREDRTQGFDYWLNVVKLLSGGSPVLMVLNKTDVRIKEIDEKGLREKFGNIVGFYRVSVRTGEGIRGLAQEVTRQIARLPHVGDEWPARWSQVRALLEGDQRNYIDYEEYIAICERAGVLRQQADLLSFYLHHLGVILHFQDDPVLRKIVMLKPEWGTNAVYAVLDTKKVQQRNGRFAYRDLAEIWGQTEYPVSRYPELLQLMARFELCFQLEGSSDYIAPELLSPTQPEAPWTDADTLRFEYQYTFMPAGIITRFIARNHLLIERAGYWRFGVILAWEDTHALVIAEPLYSRIRVSVAGKDKKGLLSIIRREIQHIHRTLNDPPVRQMIPCVCSPCQAGDPFLFEHQRVRNYYDKGIRDIVCDKSFQQVSTEQLLTGVFSQAELAVGIAGESRVYIENYYEGGAVLAKAKRQNVEGPVRSPWLSGSFYLFAAVVLLVLLAALAKLLNWWVLPVVVIGGLLAVVAVGALQLRQDERLSETNFLRLMALSFRQLPLLKQIDAPGKKGVEGK